MTLRLLPALSLACLPLPAPMDAAKPHPKFYCTKCARNAKGTIQRSASARHAFARQTGYPHGRPGYVIDHIVPLACGGTDVPSNMQWQSVADAKVKDAVERKECGS